MIGIVAVLSMFGMVDIFIWVSLSDSYIFMDVGAGWRWMWIVLLDLFLVAGIFNMGREEER